MASYIVNTTDGSIVATVEDGSINNETSLTLIGKNYSGYGEILSENFIKVLESGANAIPPTNSLRGQLWYDTSDNLLKIYNGEEYVLVSPPLEDINTLVNVNPTAPLDPVKGLLWYDDSIGNNILKIFNGISYIPIVDTSMSAEDILDILSTGSGSGSGLDADKLDGLHKEGFSLAEHSHLVGDLTDLSTNGSVAKLENQRLFKLTGSATSNEIFFDGTDDVIFDVDIVDNGHNHLAENITDLAAFISGELPPPETFNTINGLDVIGTGNIDTTPSIKTINGINPLGTGDIDTTPSIKTINGINPLGTGNIDTTPTLKTINNETLFGSGDISISIPTLRTINNQSILGSGNIVIESETLPSFKTINGNTIIGTGNIDLSSAGGNYLPLSPVRGTESFNVTTNSSATIAFINESTVDWTHGVMGWASGAFGSGGVVGHNFNPNGYAATFYNGPSATSVGANSTVLIGTAPRAGGFWRSINHVPQCSALLGANVEGKDYAVFTGQAGSKFLGPLEVAGSIVVSTSATIGGAAYPFTGSHNGFTTTDLTNVVDGDILVNIPSETKTIGLVNNIIIVDIGTTPKAKNVVGVVKVINDTVENALKDYVELYNEEAIHIDKPTSDPDKTEPDVKVIKTWTTKGEELKVELKDHSHVGVISIGEGAINVCAENGNIEGGDYITSSTTFGKGMKQDDDLLHNYTVAKSLEDVDWSSEIVGENGCQEINGIKWKQIGCTYHCG